MDLTQSPSRPPAAPRVFMPWPLPASRLGPCPAAPSPGGYGLALRLRGNHSTAEETPGAAGRHASPWRLPSTRRLWEIGPRWGCPFSRGKRGKEDAGALARSTQATWPAAFPKASPVSCPPPAPRLPPGSPGAWAPRWSTLEADACHSRCRRRRCRRRQLGASWRHIGTAQAHVCGSVTAGLSPPGPRAPGRGCALSGFR